MGFTPFQRLFFGMIAPPSAVVFQAILSAAFIFASSITVWSAEHLPNIALLNEINRPIKMLEVDRAPKNIEHVWREHEMLLATRETIPDSVTLAGGILAVLFGIMAWWIINLRKHIRIRDGAQAGWNKQGRAIRMAGSITDDTRRKQAEERINLLQRITMEVATAKDLSSALEVILRRVCEKTGWALGQAWIPNQNGTALEWCPAWCALTAGMEDFRLLSQTTTFESLIGLPGRVWNSRRPVWIRDVTQDPNFSRAEAARRCGIKSGLAVPILGGDKVIAVLEFFLKEPRDEDEQLIQVITAIAAQIGLVIDRKRVEEALRKSEEMFRAVVEDQSEMIVRWKPDGTRTFVNAAYCRKFGGTPEEFIGTRFSRLVSEPDREAVLSQIRQLTPSNPVSTEVHCSVSPEGELLWQEWTDRGIFDANGQLVELQSTGRDITDRKRAEEALRNSEESLRATIENTPGVAVQWYDVHGRVWFWNSASETVFGWKAREALGKTVDQLMLTTEEAAAFVNLFKEIARSGKSIGPVEFDFHRRDGSPRVCLSTIFQIPVAAGQSRFVCMDVDVTERKAAEDSARQGQERELRAREEFAQQLIASQEAERRRIAGELHDSLGQNLSIIKNRMHLALTENSTAVESRAQLEAINDLVSQAIIEVRQISRDLHPYQINHLGLTRAIEAMINATEAASQIKFHAKLDQVDECFSSEAAVNLYRIVQESLNNVLKHSDAKQVNIEMERDVHEIQLKIEDDGCGFNMSCKNGGLGLRNMAERVRILCGQLKIQSEPNQGARVAVTIPIAEEKCL